MRNLHPTWIFLGRTFIFIKEKLIKNGIVDIINYYKNDKKQRQRWIQVWRIKPKQNVTFTNIILKKTYVHLWQVLSIVFVIFPIIWINLKVCRISISLREILKKWTHIKCVHYILIRFLFHLLTTRQNHKTL